MANENESNVGSSKVETEMKKQGAYGKVTTHSESKLSQILRFDEVYAALNLLYIKPLNSNLKHSYISSKFSKNYDDLTFCNDILGKVSRSFAAVVRQLPPSLLVDVMVFYLVLRALDTVEDDMEAFEFSYTKINHLVTFHETALGDENWNMDGVGQGDERRLLQEFPKCHRIFKSLPKGSQTVIKDITQRMAKGMAEFVEKDLGQGTINTKEYNRYCHFVAGLVGEGLSRLFSSSKLEKESLSKELNLSNQMGLFLQKTNIIRDYLEDYVDGRAFWPQDVWKKYSKDGNLGYFANQKDKEVKKLALHCLNELVTDALELVPDCLAYLAHLENPEIFRFCAIPQVMAIATLDKCFANSQVFTGVVKIRKGLSCNLILNTNDLAGVLCTFNTFAKSIKKKLDKNDPNYDRTKLICGKILYLTEEAYGKRRNRYQMKVSFFVCMIAYFMIERKFELEIVVPVVASLLILFLVFN